MCETRPLSGDKDGFRPGVMIMCSSLYGGGAERVACRLACDLSDDYRVVMLYIQDMDRAYPPASGYRDVRHSAF